MGQEIELKLALPAGQGRDRGLGRLPAKVKCAAPQHAQIENIYFDTPGGALRRRGVALRLRRIGRRWLQTVKCAGDARGGLATRPEWEVPYAGAFDFSAIDDARVRGFLERARDQLTPLFETRFTRTTWRCKTGSSVLLLALDRGWIAADGRREALLEIEIEIEQGGSGGAADVYALARQIAQQRPVAPLSLSKAERGHRLAANAPPAPVNAAALELAINATPLAAFRHIALDCLEHLQTNHAGAVASADPEYIHQMRVAARRLRAALRLFKPVLPPECVAGMSAPLREITAVLGAARDLDVLWEEIVAPVERALSQDARLAALAGRIHQRRRRARRAALAWLKSTRYGESVLLIGELLQRPPFAAPQPPPQPDIAASLLRLADKRIRRLLAQLRQQGHAARNLHPKALHRFRIGVKRLRYALEFFASLARKGERKNGRRALALLARAQKSLGVMSDLARAGDLLMACAGSHAPLREAVALIGGWHGERHDALMRATPELVARIHRLRLKKLARR